MLIKIQSAADVQPSEITPESIYQKRRDFLRNSIGIGLSLAAAGAFSPLLAKPDLKLNQLVKSKYSTDEKQTDFKDITSYNNFYELGTSKKDPSRYAHELKTEPWSVTIAGECEKPGKLTLEDFIKPHALEERIYRLRCVEGWSMVIPWVGFSLADVLKRFQPTSKAKYVAFETLFDPKNLHGQRRRVLDWPYVEGLRMDEAMNPLAMLAVGLYGQVLPNQNGAPLRLVVPWKYGFKSIKSIVKISFTEKEPPATWNVSQPSEYGFYSNVNPAVPHPRWSQKRERRIGEFRKRKTLPFNGYGEQVASLYSGMDLKKYF